MQFHIYELFIEIQLDIYEEIIWKNKIWKRVELMDAEAITGFFKRGIMEIMS